MTAQAFERLLALASLGRQETVEQEVLVVQPGCRERCRHRAGAGQGHDFAPGGTDSGNDAGTRIGDPRRTGIGNQRHGLAGLQFLDDAGSGFRLYDLATALIPGAGTPGAAAMTGALLDGYAGAGGVLPADAADLLALFLMLRAQASSAWARGRTPPGDPRRARYRQRAVDLTEGWLARA